MADFMQLDMTQPAAKGLLASFIVLFVGAIFSIHAQLAGTSTSGPSERYMKCANQACDYDAEVSIAEQKKMAVEQIEKIQTENPDLYQQLTAMMAQRMGPMGQMMAENPEMSDENLINTWGSPDMRLAFTCPKCSQDMVYNAIKCEKCGKIFFIGGQGDKCPDPKCGYSKSEERRKEYKAQKGKK
jgi:hypothetical protein